jgi:Family of unknown function (DUF6186)
MNRLVTLLGYAVIAVAAVALEAGARRSAQVTTFGEMLSVVLRRWPLRVAVLAGWLWLGWHLFVRVEWR